MQKHKSFVLKKVLGGTALAIIAAPLFAKQAEAAAPQTQENIPVLFWAMVGMIVVLGIVIIVMALLLKTVLLLKHEKPRETATTGSNTSISRVASVLLLMTLLGSSNTLFAQETLQATTSYTYDGMNPFIFYGLITIIAILLGIVGLLYLAIIRVLKPQLQAQAATAPKKVKLMEKLNASVPIEQEKDVMLDHDYDGIRELDNNLPPWWKYGFYITIVFACIYLWRFHVSGSGKLQLAEYEEQLTTAEAEVKAYKEKMGNLVDENTVTPLTDASSITSGKTLFIANCAACHGQLGEGGVGPNLTDAYWLHGGGVKNVFKTIKYGWPQKGMKAWEKDFGAKQIQEISSFILTLQGTNPPNAKEKQGEPDEAIPATPAPTDSSTAMISQ